MELKNGKGPRMSYGPFSFRMKTAQHELPNTSSRAAWTILPALLQATFLLLGERWARPALAIGRARQAISPLFPAIAWMTRGIVRARRMTTPPGTQKAPISQEFQTFP
jgi:hypothetical protein